MELLLEKEKTITSVKSSNDWLKSIETFVDKNPKLFEYQDLPNIVNTPESWDKLMDSCVKGNIAGDSSKEATGKQFMIYATNWLDGAKTTESSGQVVFLPDAVVSGYIKLNNEGNARLDFKTFGQNDLSKDIFQLVDQNEATVFTEDQANLLMKYIKKILNRPDMFKNKSLDNSSLEEIEKYYYTASNRTKIKANQNSDELKEVTSLVDIQTLKDTSNYSVGKVIPNNIKDLYVATYLNDDFTIVSSTTGDQVKAVAVNYFGGNDIRQLIYDKVANKNGWTNDPILLSYAVLKKFYGGFYEELDDPKRLLTTVNTLANLELSGEKLLANIKNTSETKYFLAGCGGFNAEPFVTKTGDSKQKIALFNDLTFGNFNWDELINKQDKDLKANLKLNLFLTTNTGKQILDDLARAFKQGLENRVTENIVAEALKELFKISKITYDNLNKGLLDVKPNTLATIENYISAFTVQSRTPSDDVKFQLTYTRADADSPTVQPFDHEITTDTDYEVYSIRNVQLTFKKGTTFEIKGGSQTDLAKENLKRWHSTNSTSTKDVYAPFSLDGNQTKKVVFNNNYKCSGVIIRAVSDKELLDTAKGIQFVDLDLLEGNSQPKEEEKPKEEQPATVENNTKPKNNTKRKSKLDLKDKEALMNIAAELQTVWADPNLDKNTKREKSDTVRTFLKDTYTQKAIGLIPDIIKGAKYSHFSSIVNQINKQNNIR